MANEIQTFIELFQGLNRAYGIYELEDKPNEPGIKILGKPRTVQGNVTEQLWLDHLNGKSGLGIVPIMDNSKCFFGAIDIDIYTDFDYASLIRQVYKEKHPLIPFRSKSGGLHLFIFMKDPVPAKLLISKLKMIASYLGQGKAEIFPKQTEILAERGDIGQWINLPYYDNVKTNRYAYNSDGEKMSLIRFVALATEYRLSLQDLEAYELKPVEGVEDGPICLEHMIKKGFSPGARNDSMFMLGVYLKQKNPDIFKGLIEEYNYKYCDPPLSIAEIQNIQNSLSKRDYFYTCDRTPFKDHCDKVRCKLRKYGIASTLEMPNLTCLTKFDSNPPIWFVDVEDAGRLELTTDEIQSQSKFQRKCMEKINQMPPPVKPAIWQSIIATLLENVTIVEVPEDASPMGLFYEYLERFCTSKAQARVKDELLLGKPYTENGRHYFRLLDLISFLERNHFKDFKINKITSMIQEIDGKHHFFKLKEKGVNVWSIPVFPAPIGTFDTPDIEDKAII